MAVDVVAGVVVDAVADVAVDVVAGVVMMICVELPGGNSRKGGNTKKKLGNGEKEETDSITWNRRVQKAQEES